MPCAMAREARRKVSRHPEPASPRATVTHRTVAFAVISASHGPLGPRMSAAPHKAVWFVGLGARCPSLTWLDWTV